MQRRIGLAPGISFAASYFVNNNARGLCLGMGPVSDRVTQSRHIMHEYDVSFSRDQIGTIFLLRTMDPMNIRYHIPSAQSHSTEFMADDTRHISLNNMADSSIIQWQNIVSFLVGRIRTRIR